MHMKVYGDGRWAVDHIDEDNPDMGRPVEHFFSDHPVGQFLKGVGIVACVAAVAYGGARAVLALKK